MATITATITDQINLGDNARLVSWPLLTTTNTTGSAFQNPGDSIRSVQITGTFGAGGTCVIEGSNDGTNYATLADPQGNALSFTAAGIEAILENTKYIRPRVTAGDGTTSLTVTLLASRRSGRR